MTHRVYRVGWLVVPLTAFNVLSFRPRPAFSAFGRRRSSVTTPSTPAKRSLSGRYKEKLRPLDGEAVTKFVDTHCHLDMVIPRLSRQSHEDARKAKARGDLPPRILNASYEEWRASLVGPEKGLEACVNIGCGKAALDVAASFLQYDGIYGAFGIHPLRADEWDSEVEQKLVRMMSMDKVVAWGECGLDYFDKMTRGQVKDERTRGLQREVFARQINLAVSLNKPLVVHTRFAEEDTLELLEKHLPDSHPVHVHCFTSSNTLAQSLLQRFSSLRLGFTGGVTFANAPEVRDVVQQVPLDRILLETDSPYMAPEPFRGRIAHPGHVSYVADAIAQVKGVSRSQVLETCRRNTRQMYGI
ncbi:Putative deoxyribonuclease TATDN2 [Durusdinium trenchii]|uniref:Deoxyribonuclease TATDN2 n=2 Tax=Durusdinium trenchii TaxID=1381693 RepID=A0ABP0ST61_9DINO